MLLAAALSAYGVFAGVGGMASRPVWDLSDHGGARPISSKAVLEVPNLAIPDVAAFTVEARLRFGELPENKGFTIFNQSVTETGWGLWFTTVRNFAKPLMLLVNGESYDCSYAFMRVAPKSTHTFTVTARKGWIVVYMDGRVQKSFIKSVTPNLAPIRVGGPRVGGRPKEELDGVVLEELKVWGGDEEYWGLGEERKPVRGIKAGKDWLVSVPVQPLAGKPNILCYGDSISVGYMEPLARELGGMANLYHWMGFLWQPGEEGVGISRFREVGQLADFDCVVFNNGLHSLHWIEKSVSEAEIRASYATMVRAFRQAAPRAKLVYVTTTPHTAKKDEQGVVCGLGGRNGAVLRLNEIAGKVMEAEGVAVVDAYSMLVDRLDLARGDEVHWLPPAYQMMAKAIKDKTRRSYAEKDMRD
ncbi:MAG: SGNH/GDSL hydrolase family protein [Kiritimatiellae bacterium]|nr:SGNH/GDSL hydrolase family protein [Kiritimatiellia bacterium]MBQ3340542.1 SGNH/GDSL hydrolase family protein [Kiritimatiellia bacterium]